MFPRHHLKNCGGVEGTLNESDEKVQAVFGFSDARAFSVAFVVFLCILFLLFPSPELFISFIRLGDRASIVRTYIPDFSIQLQTSVVKEFTVVYFHIYLFSFF